MNRDARALHALDRRERTPLADLPTPWHEAPRLRRRVAPEGPRIFLKRDDETGFGLGGNKVRKLEYALAPDQLAGVTHLITTGGVQSNHARVTAAAAARLDLDCILVLNGRPPDSPRGNALLHRLFGAEIRSVDSREERDAAMAEAAREVETSGGRPLVLPLGASTPIGALGYVRAAREIEGAISPDPDKDRRTWIFVASSSCGTLGGLTAGFTLLGRDHVRLVGVSADVPRAELLERTGELARGALDLLGSDRSVPEGLVDGTDDEVGEGYGIPTDASREATELLGGLEGVVLDPVYTSKAAAGMIRWLREGRIGARDRVVLLHTGGHPALFT